MRLLYVMAVLILAATPPSYAYAQQETSQQAEKAVPRVPLNGINRTLSLKIGTQISGSYLLDFRHDGGGDFSDDIAADWSDCMGGDDPGMQTAHCFDEALVKYEAVLNGVYGQVMSSLGVNAKESLRSSQRRWLEFRKSEYRAREDYFVDGGPHGSIVPYVSYFHSIYTVRERIMELMMYNGADEG